MHAGFSTPMLRPVSARTPLAQIHNHGLSTLGKDTLPSRLGPSISTSKKAFKAPRLNRKFESPLRRVAAVGAAERGPSRLAPQGDKEEKGAALPSERPTPMHSLQGGLLSEIMDSLPQTTWLRTASSAWQDLSEHLLFKGNEEVKVEPEAMMQALLDAGADSRLLKPAWVANNLRWVMWKLVSLATQCPSHCHQLLSFPVAIDEMKMRYEWEIRQGNAPILRKVLEQDESPGRLMALSVCGIKVKNETHLELTDGWYSVRTVVDSPLAALVSEGKIQIGDKLRIIGAEVSAGGAQMEALEAAKSTFLRIHYNGTHKMHAGAKLGKPANRSTITPLSTVRRDGGVIHRTLVVLQRVYPLVYHSQGQGGVMTPRAHASAMRGLECQASKIAETLEAQLQAEELGRCKAQTPDAAGTPLGARLYARAIVAGEDPREDDCTELRRHLALRQSSMEEVRQQRLAAQLQQQGLQQQSTGCFRNLLVSAVQHKAFSEESDLVGGQEAIIRVWGGSPESDEWREGAVYTVTHLMPNKHRLDRRGRMELNTVKGRTHWKACVPSPESELLCRFHHRRKALLQDLALSMIGSSFDFEGLVLAATPLDISDRFCSQWVFLCDCSTASEQQSLLAVQLKAGSHALDFLDPVADADRILIIKDVYLEGQDTANGLWQASGDENMTLQFAAKLQPKQASKASNAAASINAWADNHKDLVASLHHRIRGLLNTS